MMCVKLMAILIHGGRKVLEQNIDRLYNNAKKFASIIEDDQDFELLIKPEANILCFRLYRDDLTKSDLNLINKKARKAILEEGKFYIVQTEIDGNVYLRMAIMNPFTTDGIILNLVKDLKEKAESFSV